MFAFLMFALLVLLAIASMAVLADSGLRWWSAFGALKRQLAHCDRRSPQTPSGARRRNASHSRPVGSRQLTQRVVLPAAA